MKIAKCIWIGAIVSFYSHLNAMESQSEKKIEQPIQIKRTMRKNWQTHHDIDHLKVVQIYKFFDKKELEYQNLTASREINNHQSRDTFFKEIDNFIIKKISKIDCIKFWMAVASSDIKPFMHEYMQWHFDPMFNTLKDSTQ